MFIITSFSIYYSFDIIQINKTVFLYNQYVIYIFNNQISFMEFLSILLVGAAFIKSAQFGGHV
jgi:NADH:ubiquinone oxidoreductase subunit 5 (subunit L)/multisubunit Na+/H+ antiporter MnhA subunit